MPPLSLTPRHAVRQTCSSEIAPPTLTEARATGDAALRQRMVNLVDDFLILPVREEARQLASPAIEILAPPEV